VQLKPDPLGPKLNRPILLAAVVAIGASIGFIFGAMFQDYYSKKLIAETISERDDAGVLLERYDLVLADTLYLKSLAAIQNMTDVQTLRRRIQHTRAVHVQLFREQLESLRRRGATSPALEHLETSVDDLEHQYELLSQ
jgi:hypothetical protein